MSSRTLATAVSRYWRTRFRRRLWRNATQTSPSNSLLVCCFLTMPMRNNRSNVWTHRTEASVSDVLARFDNNNDINAVARCKWDHISTDRSANWQWTHMAMWVLRIHHWAVGKQTKQLFWVNLCFRDKNKQLTKGFVPGGTIVREQFRNNIHKNIVPNQINYSKTLSVLNSCSRSIVPIGTQTFVLNTGSCSNCSNSEQLF